MTDFDRATFDMLNSVSADYHAGNENTSISNLEKGCETRMQEAEVYGAIGESGFERLVAAFYQAVPDDEILGPMYPADDMAGAEERLRGFLIFRFGGPQTYISDRGHPRLRMRHAPFAVTPAARERWIQLMLSALNSAQLPADVVSVMQQYFENTATFLINRPGPDSA